LAGEAAGGERGAGGRGKGLTIEGHIVGIYGAVVVCGGEGREIVRHRQTHVDSKPKNENIPGKKQWFIEEHEDRSFLIHACEEYKNRASNWTIARKHTGKGIHED
jgi:hypothetical protein